MKVFYNPQIHHRRSIRLKGYDYTQLGAYFVTICTHGHGCLFGDVVEGKMLLNPFGQVAAAYWERIPRHFPCVELGTWVVMPNHIHGIIIITGDAGGGEASPITSVDLEDVTGFASNLSMSDGRDASPLRPAGALSDSLGAVVGNFKSITTRRINKMRHTFDVQVWQRNYWEHIIRTPESHAKIEDYIANNPACWQDDQLHLAAPPNSFNLEK